jgi:hypothetical protein
VVGDPSSRCFRVASRSSASSPTRKIRLAFRASCHPKSGAELRVRIGLVCAPSWARRARANARATNLGLPMGSCAVRWRSAVTGMARRRGELGLKGERVTESNRSSAAHRASGTRLSGRQSAEPPREQQSSLCGAITARRDTQTSTQLSGSANLQPSERFLWTASQSEAFR